MRRARRGPSTLNRRALLLLGLAATTAACSIPSSTAAPMPSRPASSAAATGTDHCHILAAARALGGTFGFRIAPEYVGLTLSRATELATTNGLRIRIVGLDGRCLPIRADADSGRLSVYLESDRVVAAAVQ
jgi:hypothetical protein